jgi:dual oxidase
MGNIQYLSDEEVQEFLKDLDRDKNGWISYAEVEHKLDRVHEEIAPHAKPHHLHYKSRDDEARHRFLRSVIGTDKDHVPADEFAQTVKSWNVPSLKQDKHVTEDSEAYLASISIWRRIRAYVAVEGPEILFLALVIGLQVACGAWQLVKYLRSDRYRRAFGWGVVVAKTSAGALYPTILFVILSMSRYLPTFLRKSYILSRFVNWDLSRAFHIKMSIAALALATLHAIGHLTGSFLYGSRPAQQDDVAAVLGTDAVPRPYGAYVSSLPGWTGLTAFILFWILALLSMPAVRNWSYEVFQLGHLLMFPIIGLIMAHGTAGLLQAPMLGYWLAFPTLVITSERLLRLALCFYHVPARLDVLDEETVCITATIPDHWLWPFKAGQYILLQVPQISRFQWHPFTVSMCIRNKVKVHIKTDGNWTSKLRQLSKETGAELKYVGIDGPFGAPAQRFFDFDYSMVVGAGIGITPFSGVLNDLQMTEGGKWSTENGRQLTPSGIYRPESRRGMMEKGVTQDQHSEHPFHDSNEPTTREDNQVPFNYRRIDFHWIVRDRNYLLWFSDLLNRVAIAAPNTDCGPHPSAPPPTPFPNPDIRIQTHVTTKRKLISTHVFRFLLEQHRTEQHPASPLTGLLNPTHFGRPDLGEIMNAHYEDMVKLLALREPVGRDGKDVRLNDESGGEEERRDSRRARRRLRKIGVFFCGPPVIGRELADRCSHLSARGRADGTGLEYHFMLEVFG